MERDASGAKTSAGLAVDRAAIKRELRSRFAHVEVSLSAELIADRRKAAGVEDDRRASQGQDGNTGS